MAEIRGEYKVYKPSYFLISEFFSLRVNIFIYILSSLLVMEMVRDIGIGISTSRCQWQEIVRSRTPPDSIIIHIKVKHHNISRKHQRT